MKKNLPILFCIFFVFLSYVTGMSLAQVGTLAPQKKGLEVQATIGSYYLTISGYIAPYASVVLIVDNVVLRSAVADSNGYWYISQVLVNQGLSSFCLDAVDYKRLGESYTCLKIPPATSSITKANIFLPPTLGLQKKTVNQGSEAIAWGYTMRNGKVILHLDDGRVLTVSADKDGFYIIHIPVPTAGQYELFADATFQNNSSLQPDKKTQLVVLSVGQQVVNKGKQSIGTVWNFLIGNPWGFLWLIVPIFILIIILLKKLKPEWFTWLDGTWDEVASHLPFIRRKLHHWWMQGVGY